MDTVFQTEMKRRKSKIEVLQNTIDAAMANMKAAHGAGQLVIAHKFLRVVSDLEIEKINQEISMLVFLRANLRSKRKEIDLDMTNMISMLSKGIIQ